MIGLGTNRRAFLSGGAAAVAALPIASVPAASISLPAPSTAQAAALGEARATESAEILGLGAELPAARQRYVDALVALDAARGAALKASPPIPEGLPVPFGISIFGQIGWHALKEPADLLGNPIELPGYVSPKNGKTFPVRIPTSDDILRDRQNGRWLNHGHLPEWHKGEHRRLYDLAVQYERAIEDAREASRLNEAEDEVWRAGYSLLWLCQDIAEMDAQTIAGLLIKAQAIAAVSVVPERGAAMATYASGLLPQAVCRVLGELA